MGAGETPPSMDPLGYGVTMVGFTAGQVVGDGRYVLKRLLGQGGMGVVWLAEDKRLGDEVALKFLPPPVRLDPVAIDDLRRETSKSRKLTHPNIVRIHDLHESEAADAFISMEYVDGLTLSHVRIARENRVLSWAEVEPLLRQLCAALEYAHGEKVIHRDLKPGNLMLDSRGRLKLADFGIARVVSDSMSRMSMPQGTSGSPPYMSPQQMDGKTARPTDDIYALGATLYELLTSKPPFYSGDVIYQARNLAPEPMAQRLAEFDIENPIPPEVEALILACLAKEPEQRPQSAAEVLERLSRKMESPRPKREPKQNGESPTPKKSEAVGFAEAVKTVFLTLFFFVIAAVCLFGTARLISNNFETWPLQMKSQVPLTSNQPTPVSPPVPVVPENTPGTSTPPPVESASTLAKSRDEVLTAYSQKDYDKTVSSLNEYDKIPVPTDPQAALAARLPATLFYWLAETARKAEKWHEAETFYTRVTQQPDSGELLAGAWWQLGEVQSQLHEWTAAVSSYEKYRELIKPDQQNASVVLLALGRAQLGAQNLDLAKKLGEQALAQESEGSANNAAARMLLGETAFASQNYTLAAQIFSTLAVLDNDPQIAPQAISRAADAFEKTGDAKSASDWRQKLKEKYPDYPSDSTSGTPMASTPASGQSIPQPAVTVTQPVAGQPWTNSLGMKFVPAGTDGVLFGIWDVRVKDFQAFVDATGYDATGDMASIASFGWQKRGDTWKSPGFAQTDDCPVVGVSWNDAHAFCDWLTKKEQAAGTLGPNQKYRLPTDGEWSKAVGLDESAEGTPKDKDSKITGIYPWGTQWPPPQGAGNYAGSEAKDAKWPSFLTTIDGYTDGYPHTSPVGSFAANRYGLYDMGGNVYQWCEDNWDLTKEKRVLRGAAWFSGKPSVLLSSCRTIEDPGFREDFLGFRIVVVTDSPAPTANQPSAASPAPAQPLSIPPEVIQARAQAEQASQDADQQSHQAEQFSLVAEQQATSARASANSAQASGAQDATKLANSAANEADNAAALAKHAALNAEKAAKAAQKASSLIHTTTTSLDQAQQDLTLAETAEQLATQCAQKAEQEAQEATQSAQQAQQAAQQANQSSSYR